MTAAPRDASTSERDAGGRETPFRQQSIPLTRLAQLRESAYRALSQSFLAPSPDVARAVVELTDEWAADKSLAEEFTFAADFLRLRSAWAGLDGQGLQTLQGRHFTLFVTATSGIPCPPFESSYLASGAGDEGHLLAAIERDYATVGLYVSPEQKQPPDHISMELEFMAILCGREAEMWESKETKRAARLVEKERKFLGEHLISWLGAFTRDIEAADPDGIYSLIGRAALAFVAHERDLGEELASRLMAAEGPAA